MVGNTALHKHDAEIVVVASKGTKSQDGVEGSNTTTEFRA